MPSPAPWYENFFNGFILEAQRRLYSEQQTQLKAAFLREALAPAAGCRILDVPCGNGRLTRALAATGCEAVGVDFNEAILADARQAAAAPGSITFHLRDMRDLPWEGHFDAAFCFGNSFGYFEPEGNEAFLRAVHRSLTPGGRFALETHFVAEVLFPQQLGRRWYPFGDLFFLHDTMFDPATSKLTSNYTLVQEGRIERKQAVYQVYTFRELRGLLEAVGFTVVETFGSLNREPLRLGSPGAWFVMRKG